MNGVDVPLQMVPDIVVTCIFLYNLYVITKYTFDKA